MKLKHLAVGVAAAALILAACGGGDDSTSSEDAGGKAPNISAAKEVGAGEGALDLVAWAGYVENGSTDPKVDWVTQFEKDTGCKVNVKVGNSSDEMVTLMKTGQYDGVSASGDASLRLIFGGVVAPVNTDLVPNYADISSFLKDQPYNSVDGKMYGIPHGWGANLLMYRTDVVNPAPTSWGAVFDTNSPYKGKVTAYDSAIYIADAALYLSKSRPELGITNPYALDQKQFDAAVALLKDQKPLIGEYWKDYAKAQQAFEQGTLVLGTTWQVIANLAKANNAPVETVLPTEGSTGWSDTWMIAAKAKHPNCMYKWMDHIASPQAQASVAEWFGEAPANPKACDLTGDTTHCDTFKAKDEGFYKKVSFWATPTKSCLDGRGNKCVPYSEWLKAWTGIKG